jgi:hypothetical protein
MISESFLFLPCETENISNKFKIFRAVLKNLITAYRAPVDVK